MQYFFLLLEHIQMGLSVVYTSIENFLEKFEDFKIVLGGFLYP